MISENFHKTVSVYPEPTNQAGGQFLDFTPGVILSSPNCELRLDAFPGENSNSHLISNPGDGARVVFPEPDAMASMAPPHFPERPRTDLVAGRTVTSAQPAALLGPQGPGDAAAHMSLQDMLVTAARIRNELQANSNSQTTVSALALVTPPTPLAQQQTTSMVPGEPPRDPRLSTVTRADVETSRLSGSASSNSDGAGIGAGPASARPGSRGSRIPPPPPTEKPRGPLEALRDELFGDLVQPSPSFSPSSGMPPVPMPTSVNEPGPTRAPPVPPLALGMLPLPAPPPASLPPLPPLAWSVATGSLSQYSGTAGLNSPTPSTTATHFEHDLAYNYSMPEFGLNAVAYTPLSITTAAVSELDTPSSARSRDEEYYKSLPSPRSGGGAGGLGTSGGGGGSALGHTRFTGITPGSSGGLMRRVPLSYDISSGYDDYVVPAAWTSLRERHSGSKVQPPLGAGDTPAGGLLQRYDSAGGVTGSGLTADISTAAVTTVVARSAAPVNGAPELSAAPSSAPTASPTPRLVMPQVAAALGHLSSGLPLAEAPHSQAFAARVPPLLVSFDSVVGDAAAAAAGTPSGDLPTLGTGFGSLAGPVSSGAIGSAGREPSGSGQLFRSLSFGVPSGATSRMDSGAMPRTADLIAIGDGGGREWGSGRHSRQLSSGPPTLGCSSTATEGTRSDGRSSCSSLGEARSAVVPSVAAAAVETRVRSSRYTGSDGSGSAGCEGSYPEHVAGLGDMTWVNPLFAPDGTLDGGGSGGGGQLESSDSLSSSLGASPGRATEPNSTLTAPETTAIEGGEVQVRPRPAAGQADDGDGSAGRGLDAPAGWFHGAGSGSSEEQEMTRKEDPVAGLPVTVAPDAVGASAAGHVNVLDGGMTAARRAAGGLSAHTGAIVTATAPRPPLPAPPAAPPPSSLGCASSPSSIMSAALVGAVPLQNREERVRNWAEGGADFGVAPPPSGSHSGLQSSLAATPESSWFGTPLSEPATSLPPSPRLVVAGPAPRPVGGGSGVRAQEGQGTGLGPEGGTAVYGADWQVSAGSTAPPLGTGAAGMPEAATATTVQDGGTKQQQPQLASPAPITAWVAAPPPPPTAAGHSASRASLSIAAAATASANPAASATGGGPAGPPGLAATRSAPLPPSAPTLKPPYPASADLVAWRGADAHAILDAELDRLLDMLSGRGARSEVHARLVFDSFRSAVFNAVALPRPSSTPSFTSLAAAMAEAQSAEAAAAKGLITDSSTTSVQPTAGGGGDGGALGPALDAAMGATAASRVVLEPLLPYGNRQPALPHSHLQPHLPLHPRQRQHHQPTQPVIPPPAPTAAAPQAQAQGQRQELGQGQNAQVPTTPFPLTAVGSLIAGAPLQNYAISPSGSLGSIESEVAAERLKAKTRAYLQKAATATTSGANTDVESQSMHSAARGDAAVGPTAAAAGMAAALGAAGPVVQSVETACGKKVASEGHAAAGVNNTAAVIAVAVDADGDDALDAAAQFAGLVSLEGLLRQAQVELQLLQLGSGDSGVQDAAGGGGNGVVGACAGVDIIGSSHLLQPAHVQPTQELQQQQQRQVLLQPQGPAPLSALEDILRQLQRLTRSSSGGAAARAAAAGASAGGGSLFTAPDSASVAPMQNAGSVWERQQQQGSQSGPLTMGPALVRVLESAAAGDRVTSSVGSVSLMASTLVDSSRASLDVSSGATPSPLTSGGGYGSTDGGDRRRSLPSARSPLRLRASASIDLEPSPKRQSGPEGEHGGGNGNTNNCTRTSPGRNHYNGAADGDGGDGNTSAAGTFGAGLQADSPTFGGGVASSGGGWASVSDAALTVSDAETYLDLAFQAAILRDRMDLQQQQHAWPRPRAVSPERSSAADVDMQPPRSPTPPEEQDVRNQELYYQVQALKLAEMRQQQLLQQQQQQYHSHTSATAAPAPVADAVDWQAALEAKLLPYNAVRQHGPGARALLDASAALVDWRTELVAAAAAHGVPRQQPTPTRRRGTAAASIPNAAAPGGQRARPASPARSARPAGAAVKQGPTGAAAAARSAPVTPHRGNSPARTSQGPQPQQRSPAASTPPGGNAPGASARSPRAGGSASRDGRLGNGGSILDRATPRGGGGTPGAAAGNAPAAPSQSPPVRPPMPMPSEPITISRPFAWQERETRHWLEDLGLVVTPAEESLPLLDNPLRNGLLLAALASRLAGNPLPPGVVTDPPRDVRSARTNILCALDHLGLLAASWAPPADAERRAWAQAAAAEMAAVANSIGANKAAAAAGTGPGSAAVGGGAAAPLTSSRPRSPNPPPGRNAAAGPTAGSSGIIAIKALGSAGRGYALRLKERQLRAGLGLVAEVESVLAGMYDNIWGLLNFIRLACAPHYLRGASTGPCGGGAVSASVALAGAFGGAWRRRPEGTGHDSEEAIRRSFDVRGGPGVEGTAGMGPAPVAAAAAAAAGSSDAGGGSGGVRTTPSRGGRGSGSRSSSNTRNSHHQRYQQGSSPARSPSGKTPVTAGACRAAAAVTGGHGDDGRSTGTPPRRVRSAMAGGGGGRGNAGGRGRSVTPVRATADPRGSPSIVLMAGHAAHHQHMAAAVAPAGGSGGGSATPDAGLLYRPLWPRLPSLPYSAVELASLEQSLLRWLQESGAISRREAAQGFTYLLPMFEDGTFICWLVSNLSGHPIVGAHRRPLTEAARRTNWIKAIEALRKLPGMSRRFLVYEEALIHCERAPLTGLLEDLHRLSAGMPPAPSTLQPNAKPYLPYSVPEPAVHMLPPDRIAVNRGASPPLGGQGGSRGTTPEGAPATAASSPSPSPHKTPLYGTPRSSSPRSSPSRSRPTQVVQAGEGGGGGGGSARSPIRAAWPADGDGPDAGAAAARRGGDTPRAKSTEPSPPPSVPRQRPHSAAPAVRRAAAVGGDGEDSAAAAGSGGNASYGRYTLITDQMVSPVKSEGVVPPGGVPYRRRSANTPRDLVADGTTDSQLPAPSARALDALLFHSLYPTHHIHLLGQQRLRRSTVGGGSSAGGGGSAGSSRSAGGALESMPQSPLRSPRLRLVPAAL